jgi:hypothetical protein
MFDDRHDGGRVGGSHTLEHVGLGGTVQPFSQRVPRDGIVVDFAVDRDLPTLQNGRSEWWIDRVGGDEFVNANRTSVSNTRVGRGGERKEESLSLSPAGSGGLSKDGDSCRIASKDVDVALDPLQRQSLVVIPDGERNSQCR